MGLVGFYAKDGFSTRREPKKGAKRKPYSKFFKNGTFSTVVSIFHPTASVLAMLFK